MKKLLMKILTLCLILCCSLCVFTACENGEDNNTQITSISIISTKTEYYLDEFNYDDYTIKVSFVNDTYKEIALK